MLWVATLNGGLNYKKPIDRQFQRIDKKQLKGNLNIIHLLESPDQFIWMTTEESGLYKYRLHDDSLRQYTVSDGLKTSSLIGAFYNERLVVASKGNGFFLYDNKKDTFTSIPIWNNLLDESAINDVYIYNDKTIFVGTNHGVVSITGYVDVTSKRYLSDKIISAVFCEDANQIWAGTRGEGLYCIAHENEDVSVKNFKNNMFDLSSISSDMIFDIVQDFSGNIWITTEEGVSYFDPLKQNFSLITNNIGGEQRLSDKNIWTIYEESDSVVWVGTRKGLSKINIANQTTLNYPFFSENKFLAANNDIWDICVDENNQFWVGTNSGIYQFNPAIKQNNYKKFSPSLTDLNQPIYDINFRNSNELWVATKNGLYAFDLNKNQHILFNSTSFSNGLFPDHPCRRILFLDQDVWLGFDGGGLCKLQQIDDSFALSSFSITQFIADEQADNTISHNTVLSMCEGDENTLWVGTFGGGLNKLNLTTNNFEIYTESDGLSNNNIYGIIEDQNNHLWISTNFGISEFNPKNEKFKNYNEGNGLQSNEFNNNSYFQSNTGRIYFGGINGFNYFTPKDIKFNNTPPKTLITDIKWLNDGIFEDFLINRFPYNVDTILLTFFSE